MNIVDSSGWLEYFSAGPNARHPEFPLKDPSTLIVSVIAIHEVFKVVIKEANQNDALQAVAAMQKGKTIDISAVLAMEASRLSLCSITLPWPAASFWQRRAPMSVSSGHRMRICGISTG